METVALRILGSEVTLARRLNKDVVWYGDVSGLRLSQYSSGWWCVLIDVTPAGTGWTVSASHIVADLAAASSFIDHACTRLGIEDDLRAVLGLRVAA